MDDRFEEDDRQAIAAMTTAPPHRKAHSYSQQLRTASGTDTMRSQLRKHSLDECRISSIADYYDDSDDGEWEIDGYNDSRQVMPEFVAGGGTGIFKAPTRAAVHPHRPPGVELRPHPLRETQVGKFIRTIASTETQLWAGQESGVRFWNHEDMFVPGTGLIGGRVRRGDEDAAPFYESGNTSPTMCMVVDEGNRVVWTGHKDGKIRWWNMDQSFAADDYSPVKEGGVSWQAHKGPVLSMAFSSYGDLWTGSEAGVIKIWPWDSIEKSLSVSPEEMSISSFLIEKPFVDLRTQVTINNVCKISSSDVKIILSDNTRGRVWCAGSTSFSLWDARTRELVKVFNIEGNIEGQLENRVEMPLGQETTIEDEIKVKFVSTSKKDKSQGFLQRSRHAIMGAADAVRRVATRGTGAFNEELKKTECMVMTMDGIVWSGCSNGTLVRWDGNGNRLNDFNHHACAVLSFCTYSSRLWVGYASGLVQILDLDGNLLAGWISYSSPVVRISIGGGFVFCLATHGGIRAWHLTSPGPLDRILRTKLAAKELLFTKKEHFKILVGTWNVGQGKASPEALRSWLGSVVSDVGIVVVGLQEVEMGAGFLAISVAKETVGLEGSATGQWWQDAIGKTLDEGPTFERVGSRQLAGLLITIWVRKTMRTHVGDLDVSAVACGFGRTIGNKGGVGLRLRVHDRILCFINCHLAAHVEAVNRRNADFDHIFRTMVFSRQSNLLNVSSAAVSTANLALRNTNMGSIGNSEEAGRPDLSKADMVMFLGDFNYRLFGISYDEARDLISQRSFDWLREKDQLRAEMKAGKVFQGMREAIIRFPPTYKFDRHTPGLGGYDSGEKKRIPAWCDRIIYRDSQTTQVTECNLDCPVVAAIQFYEACMDVTDSDHKPVRCKLSVRLARVDRSVRRKEFGIVMKSNQIKALIHEYSNVPEIVVSRDNILLQNQETFSLWITNKCVQEPAFIHIQCEGQYFLQDGGASDPRPRGSFGLPSWLEVSPATGIVYSDQPMEVIVRHVEFHTLEELVQDIPQTWWQEDTKDKEVILRVNVKGSISLESKTHHVRVRHCYSSKSIRTNSRTSNPNYQGHEHNYDMDPRV